MSIMTVAGVTTITLTSGLGAISLKTAFAGDTPGSIVGGTAAFSGTSALSNGVHKIIVGGTIDIGSNIFGFAYTSSHTINSNLGNTVESFDGNGNFYPIGYIYNPSSGVGTESEFTGIFDGNGYVISGAQISVFSSSANTYAGLFAKLSAGAEVRNVSIVNGSTVAVSSGEKDAYAGGIAGLSQGTVINSYNKCSISAVSSMKAHAGGISGSSESSSSITDCYNSGIITAISPGGIAIAGGISGGLSRSAVTDCYNTGSVTAMSPDSVAFAGGISGNSMTSSITKCYNTGTIEGTAPLLAIAGGISGYSQLSVSNSYNAGRITATSTLEADAGGIVGYSFGASVSNSYNIGQVTATASGATAYAGGILGYAVAFQTSNITNCYFLKDRVTANLSVTNALYNCSTTPHLVVADAGGKITNPANSVPARITGASSVDGNDQWSGMKTESQMRPTLANAQAPAPGNSIYYRGATTISGTPTVTVPGWDFQNIWTIVPGTNEGFPILRSFLGITVSITEQPQDKTVLEGGTATFSFDATVTPKMLPQYQWYICVPGGTWAAMPGETGKSLLFGPAQVTDDGTQFRVSVTVPGYNDAPVLSQIATLHVLATYAVTLPTGTGYTVTAYGSSSSYVIHGGSFTFQLSLAAGYSGGQVSVNGTPVTLDANGMYTITNITADQTVTVSGVTQNTYSVTLTPGTGYTLTADAGSSSPVTHGGSYTFVFSLNAGYTNSQYQVLVNGTPVTLTAGKYTISDMTEIKTVTVTGVTQNTYNVTLPTGTGYTVTAYGGSVSPVTHGGSYTFQLLFDTGYSGGQVSVNGTPVTLDANGMYTITNITANQTVTVSGVPQNEYSVTLTQGTGYTLIADTGSSSPVIYGGSFTFVFSLNSGYEGSPYQVLVNGTPITLDTYGKYTISNITEIQTVTVTGVDIPLNTYNVTLPTGAGYTVTAYGGSVSPVANNGSYTFRFSLAAGYSGGQVSVNGTPVTLDANGMYTITNITANQTVTVSGVTQNTYSVTLTLGTGYTLTADAGSSSPATYGGSFTFAFSLNEGYTNSQYQVLVNGAPVTLTTGKYTIPNITESKTVTVTGVTENNYSVTLPAGTGYTVTAYGGSASPVTHGGSYTFRLSLAAGYSGGQVSVNGTPITLDANGMYTITNITTNQTVTVSGVTQNTYSVTLTLGTGYTLTAVTGSSSPATHGGSFTFQLSLAAGYSGGQVSVNGTPVTLDAYGRYTISNITEMKIVNVTGVAQNKYSVTLPIGAGYTVTAYGGSASPVTHGGSYTFQFLLATGYSGGQVSVNGMPVTLDANGRYTITNITTNQAITVSDIISGTYAIAGSVKEGANNLSGVSVSYTIAGVRNGTVTTDADGIYIISGIPYGSTVNITGVTKANYTVNENLPSVISNMTENKTQNFTMQKNASIVPKSTESGPLDGIGTIILIVVIALAIIGTAVLFVLKKKK